MTSFEPPNMTLQGIIRASGHTYSQQIVDFARLAAAVQSQRQKEGASNTNRISRSTGLWVVMQLDADIKEALSNAGVDQTALADVLSIRSVPAPMTEDTGELHDDFANAMLRYLADLSDSRTIGLADLAAAILHAGRDRVPAK